ncbi:Carboxylesterase [Mycena olivaceomarginata]|nr:Carboxylesterase [Mycena olivaceomarginata]
MHTTLTLLLALFTGHCVANAGATIVTLKYGVFQGTFDGNLSVFHVVPFAQPAYVFNGTKFHLPMRSNNSVRFALPKLPSVLHGVQNATVFSPSGPQQTPIPPPLIPPPFAAPLQSEDCLKLNVFAPSSASSRSKLPVLVRIYGDSFEIGSSADTEAWVFLAGKEVADEGITNLGLRDRAHSEEIPHEL